MPSINTEFLFFIFTTIDWHNVITVLDIRKNFMYECVIVYMFVRMLMLLECVSKWTSFYLIKKLFFITV